ncbi:hypothetical protein AcV5_009518 [Taiwanofungus camphoratus]|nr:hypothetical protein AcV5_009518 [Antrodia cinnamomea]
MSTDSTHSGRHVDKGKARARSPEPNEITPLLGSASGSVTSGEEPENTPYGRRLYSRLVTVFLISLSLCILTLILLVLIIYSYRSRAVSASPNEILQHALVVRGPDRVDVLNTTGDGGIWLTVHGRLGLDAGNVSGVNTAPGDNVLQGAWKSLGRWGIRKLDRVTVNLTTIEISSESDPSYVLTTIDVPLLEVPLTVNPPPDTTWLQAVAFPVLMRPTKDMAVLMRFVRESWRKGSISVQAVVGQTVVEGGGLQERSWRRALNIVHSDIHVGIQIRIPKLPGLPQAGHDNPLPDFAELVTLQSFVITSERDTLSIRAQATAIDLAPPMLNFTAPPMPFVISLPAVNATAPCSSVEIANVYTQSFTLTHPNITLTIDGTVLPLSKNTSATMSAFLRNYVSGRDSAIIVSTPLLPNVSAGVTFPAPHPKPEILRNVTIREMKIKPAGSAMVASGTVFARVVLPRGIDVGLDVSRVFPDVLVYDGEVPSGDALMALVQAESFPVYDGDPDVPPAPPLPGPLPDRAFAHIRPDHWLASVSQPAEGGEGDGSAVEVSAKIVDVPLEVLPGREREFSNFVSKVVFGTNGAVAGVQGIAAVAVHVHGLPFENGRDGEMEFTGLPFQGSVRIGKRSMLDGFLSS